jgi:DNA polymerase III epsilon subunit-like protein
MWRVLFRVIDIETTGLSPPAEILEIGRVDILIDDAEVLIERPKARLYRPLNGMHTR